jgi:hypothetical protein
LVVVVDGVGEESVEVVVVVVVGGLEGVEGVGHVVELLVLVVPVFSEPGGGLDEVPPLRGEVLDLLDRGGDEERGVRVQLQRRRDHGAHGSLPSFLGRQIEKHGGDQ